VIAIQSSTARRVLARHMAAHDPETLAFFTVMAETFGPFQRIDYTGPAEAPAREELTNMRKQAANIALAQAREALA
jgi:hypothetical protein